MIEHEGKNYARVSDILKPFSDFSSIDEEILNRKAELGTMVHKAIADDISGEFPILNEKSLPYFESYLLWREALNPSFIQSEQRYFCSCKRLTGQIDTLIVLQNSPTPVLIDFKTSASESKEVWPMQAHLYSYLLTQNQIAHSTRFLFVKLCKRGNLPQVFEYKFSSNTMQKCFDAIDNFWKK